MKDNEWVSVEDRLPRIGEEVNVLYGKSDSESVESSDIYRNMIKRSNDRTTYYWKNTYKSETLSHWRHLPEKRPDFSRLKEGDLIHITPKYDKKYFAGYITFVDDDSVTITIGNKDYQGFHDSFIKKITRINIAEQKFEEI